MLTIRELVRGSDEYSMYLESTRQAALDCDDLAEGLSVTDARFFDIKILAHGDEIEPDSSVQVVVRYDDPLGMNEEDELNVVHFAPKGGTEILKPDADNASGGPESDIDTIRFTRDSGSVTGTFVVRKPLSGTLETADGTYHVTVDYDENACIPSDASLKVREIGPEDPEYAAYYSRSAAAVTENSAEESGTIRFARFLDITILARDGVTEIEPKGPVQVNISLVGGQTKNEATEINVLHFDEAGDTEVLENVRTRGSKEMLDSVSFEADGFSWYGIIGTGAEKNVLESGGDKYHITVICGDETDIPKNVRLEVEEISDTSELYGEYVSKTGTALGMEDGSAGYIRLFDISIADKDDRSVKYQPAKGTAVDVLIELEDSESGTLGAVRFADDGDLVVSGVTAEDGSVSFSTGELGVFSVAETGKIELKAMRALTAAPVKAAVSLGSEGSILPAQTDDANAWQIVEEGYEGNTSAYKTVLSDDHLIRVQKNVIPTAVENEFLVYLSADSLSRTILTFTQFSEFISDLSWYTGQAANQSVGDNGDLIGQGINEKALGSSDREGFELTIRYNGEILAHEILGLSVPNSAVFIRVNGDYIQIAHVFKNARPGQEGYYSKNSDGYYIVNVDLTDRAYEALLHKVTTEMTTTETVIGLNETGNAYVEDIMGDYMVYDSVVAVNGSVTPQAGQIRWNITGKTDPLTSEPEVTTSTSGEGTDTIVTETVTTWWNYNVAELVYKAHLDVTKDGFTSGDLCDVNDNAVLHYTDSDGEPQEVTFQKPVVEGTLYDFEFTKADEEGTGLEGAVFTLTGPAGNPDIPNVPNAYVNKTLTSGPDGKVSVQNLPWGTYTLTETTAPEGHRLPEQTSQELNIGYTDWPEDVDHKDTENDEYAYEADWKIVNPTNKITVIKHVELEGDVETYYKDHVDQQIYMRLWNQDTRAYFPDNDNPAQFVINIEDGEWEAQPMVFEGVPAGRWSAWEVDGEGNDLVQDGVYFTVDEDHKITLHMNNGELVDLSSSGTGTIEVTNTYALQQENKDVYFDKKWGTSGGQETAAPQGAWVEFKLYRKLEHSDTITEVAGVDTIRLDGTETPAWRAVFQNLPTVDEELGQRIIYLAREVDWFDQEDYLPYQNAGAAEPMGDDLTDIRNYEGVGGSIWNKRQTEDIIVRKQVTGTEEDLTKQFTFTATLSDGLSFPEQNDEGVTVSGSTASFQLANGEEIELNNVPAGAGLEIAEILEEGDTGIYTTTASGRTGGQFDAASNTYSFTVIHEEGTVLFTNERNRGALRIEKDVTVTGDAPYQLTDREFAFTVTGPGFPEGESVTIKVQPDGDHWTGFADLGNVYVGEYTVQEDADTAQFAGYVWTLTPEANNTSVTVTASHTASAPALAVVSNAYEQQREDVTFYKVWIDHNDALGLRWAMDDFKRVLTLDNGVEGAAVPSSVRPEITVSSGDETGSTWLITYADMPTYVNGEAAVYTLTETPIMSYILSGSPAAAGGTITNELEYFKLRLTKTDADTNETILDEAQFKLMRGSTEARELYTIDFENGIYTTADGQIEFNLPAGLYALSETEPPTGYVISGENEYSFEIDDDGIHGDEITSATETVGGVTVTVYTITVPNHPGHPLPSTGGSGTRPYYLFGGVLILLAGAVLLTERKRKKN